MSNSWLAGYARYDDAALITLATVGLVRRAAKLFEAEPPTWEEQSADHSMLKVGEFTVRLDGRGPAQARCPCPSAGICTHALAAAMFARQEALALGHTPDTAPAIPGAKASKRERASQAGETSGQPTRKQLGLLSQIRRELERTVSGGLSHLGANAAEQASEMAMDARLGGLPLLSRLLNTVAAGLLAVSEHGDEISEKEVTSTIAEAWALTKALESATPNWPKLRGELRRTFTADDAKPLDLLPLGAAWWVSDSGARGITLALWDRTAAEICSATTARPAGTDAASFHQSRMITAFWNGTLSTLLSGPFRLTAPKLSADGKLSPTSGSVRSLVEAKETSTDAFGEKELGAIANRLRPTVNQADFTASAAPFALVAAKSFGKLELDEPNQCLVWSLPVAPLPDDSGLQTALESLDADSGTTAGSSVIAKLFKKAPDQMLQLRQEITPAANTRIENLLALEANRTTVAFVLIQRTLKRGRICWEPLSVFTRGKEKLELISLDFDLLRKSGSLRSLLQQHWALWTKRSAESPPLPNRSKIDLLCDDVRELAVEATATGRSAFSQFQRQRCRELAERCASYGLITLSDALTALEAKSSAAQLLQVVFLADRVAALQTVEPKNTAEEEN
ncbi:MAG: hypothetical protein LBU38_03385 [Propionibacteriaceae bacterium]|jgi:hypothetical protein|nr:hypothetical protein [Propionibacteriaceae bacterium]